MIITRLFEAFRRNQIWLPAHILPKYWGKRPRNCDLRLLLPEWPTVTRSNNIINSSSPPSYRKGERTNKMSDTTYLTAEGAENWRKNWPIWKVQKGKEIAAVCALLSNREIYRKMPIIRQQKKISHSLKGEFWNLKTCWRMLRLSTTLYANTGL